MIKFFRKSIAWVITGSFSMILAACYGAPANYTYYKYMKTTNPDNEPIPGLKVEPFEDGNPMTVVVTDDEGGFEIPIVEDQYNYNYKLIITDIDSTENLGHFITKQVDVNNVDGNIIMQEKEE
jgi:hypothetical protein